jgi:hypothetical protein
MAQFHNYGWWLGRFKGEFLPGKGKMRPGKSLEEARLFVAHYEKRGGGSAHWKIAMNRAFRDAYDVEYMSPQQFKEHQAEQRIKELERQIAEKEAALKAVPVNESPVVRESYDAPDEIPDAPLVNDTPLSKEEFEIKWRNERGYPADYSLKNVERAQLGRAWKKYSGE